LSSRRRTREVVLQILYGMDLSGLRHVQAISDYEREFSLHGFETDDFMMDLIRGVQEHRDEIDTLITDASENWRVDRMSLVDRNIIRMGIYEMLYSVDIPLKVAINEAVELAKRFGSGESASFINGILDRISRNSDVVESGDSGEAK